MTETARPAKAAPPPARRGGLRRLAPLLVIACGAVLGAILLGDRLSFETLAANHEALAAWREENGLFAAAIYVTVYALAVAFSLPGALAMTLTGGFLFGLVLGSALTITAATIGAVGVFLAARTGLGERLSARISASEGAVARLKTGIERNQISVLLLMRLVPAVPFFVANLIPAFMEVRLRTYAWTTLIGIAPGTIAFTSVGAGLGEVFARGEEPRLDIFLQPHVYGPLLALCALAALPSVVGWIRGRPATLEGEA